MTTLLTIDAKKHADSSLVFSNISWPQFDAIATAFNEIAGVRLIYLDNILEIMTLSPEHEETKSTISVLIEAYLREIGIRFYVRGSATLGSREIGGQKEPDESYNLETKKAIPDLVIEVIFTSGAIDKLELYRRIGIPELWFWEDGVLQIYSLENQYQKVESSRLLPHLDLALLKKYITYFDQYDAVTEFLQELRKR
jgi:Uma2 family endonuclease